MEYISNDQYKVYINGQEVIASADDLREAFLDIKKYEKDVVNDYVETCPWSYIYEDSVKFELLRTEIQDEGYKEVQWSDELADILETAVEAGMQTAHNWYTAQYHMVRKI